jgi:hypothetical protein
MRVTKGGAATTAGIGAMSLIGSAVASFAPRGPAQDAPLGLPFFLVTGGLSVLVLLGAGIAWLWLRKREE